MKDGDLSTNPSLMWFQGGIRDLGIQSMNFQGFGGTPWMPPRLDPSSMAGIHPDSHQAMAMAALQDTRTTVYPIKADSSSLIQFQQPQTVGTSAPSSFGQRQTMHRFQQTEEVDSSHIMCSNGITVSNMQNIPSVLPCDLSGSTHSFLPRVEQLGSSNPNVSEFSNLLPPYPGRDYSSFQGSNDLQNSLLFGLNIDSSSFMMPVSAPFAASDFSSGAGVDFPLNSDVTASSCVEETGFLQSSELVDQVNPSSRTFVKVSMVLHVMA